MTRDDSFDPGMLIEDCQELLRRIDRRFSANKAELIQQHSNKGHRQRTEVEFRLYWKIQGRLNKRRLEIRAYFLLLIINLLHICAKRGKVKDYLENTKLPSSFKRNRKNQNEEVKTMFENLRFFRDALCHPEDYSTEKTKKRSPARSVAHNIYYPRLVIVDFPNEDRAFKIGDGCLSMKEIKSLLVQAKNIVNTEQQIS